ncbi:MAG: hypothetical protein EBY22_15745 [Gammaproteobacteria bacterium]|nr:hypothetical protein [Gammaproteobacteria bacterium]
MGIGTLRFIFSMLVFLSPSFWFGETQASMCNVPVHKEISFAKGSKCASFRGKATHLSGRFLGGQQVRVVVFGWANSSGWEKGWADVEGPGGFIQSPNTFGSDLQFTTPRSGKYEFSISPCALWGSTVNIEICTD